MILSFLYRKISLALLTHPVKIRQTIQNTYERQKILMKMRYVSVIHKAVSVDRFSENSRSETSVPNRQAYN